MSRKPRQQKKFKISGDEDVTHAPKPGLDSAYPHIAMAFSRQPELAAELTRQLKAPIARRLGIRRRAERRLG